MNFKYLFLFFVLLIPFFFASCEQKKENNGVSEFILQDGFDIELVAAEPLLDSPVAMQFDPSGKLWVVELPGYMRDIDGNDEEYPDGKIVILSDTNQDGIMDQRHVFLDSLVAPRTICLAYGGLLYSDKTSLYFTRIEGNKPIDKTLVDSIYVVGGNIEHQPNGLLYNIDNWIYSAKSKVRYQLKNNVWKKEAAVHRGQWGLTNDDTGRLYYNDNSNPLAGDAVLPHFLNDNPYQRLQYNVQNQLARDRRVFPFQATSVNRGYEKGVLDENDMLTNFTSSCGPLIYRGDQFPETYYGNAFVCGPEVNLVKRYLLNEEGETISASQAYEGKEFLISKEESFRPVNLYTGLDGCLYVLDLRKGVIQHRAYMTSYLRERVLKKGLEQINGIGRIYKVSSNYQNNSSLLDFENLSLEAYTGLLNHKNGAIRILAQQQLINSGDKSLKSTLEEMLADEAAPKGQLHALWTLEGLDLLDMRLLKLISSSSKNQDLVNHVLLLIALHHSAGQNPQPFLNQLQQIIKPEHALHLAYLSGKQMDFLGNQLWISLADTYKNQPLVCEALIAGIAGKEASLMGEIKHLKGDSIFSMMQQTAINRANDAVKAPKIPTKLFLDNRTAGFHLYNTYCLSCHGQDGKGNAQLAPPLYPSEYVTGPVERMILIVLQGLKGPLEVNGRTYDMNLMMPGIKNNPDLTDKKIADLIVFVKNSFTQQPTYVDEKMVKNIREQLEGQKEMFTVESLEAWMNAHSDDLQ